MQHFNTCFHYIYSDSLTRIWVIKLTSSTITQSLSANKLCAFMLKTSSPRITILVSLTNEIVTCPYIKNMHIFIRLFQWIESFRLAQCYHEQNNDYVHNSQIYNSRVARRFHNGFDNKKFYFLSFWLNKNDQKCPHSIFRSIASFH